MSLLRTEDPTLAVIQRRGFCPFDSATERDEQMPVPTVGTVSVIGTLYEYWDGTEWRLLVGDSGSGSGTDEVWIGTSAPVSPTVELWFDPDATATPRSLDYEHIQGVPDSTWTITHPLMFKPNVTVIDSAGSQVEGDVSYPDAETVTVTFSAAFSGRAYLS